LRIGKNAKSGVGHQAFEGFTRSEFAHDGLRLDALHDGGGVNDFEAGLLRRALEGDDSRTRGQIEAKARRLLGGGECDGERKAQQRQPLTEAREARRAAGSGSDLDAGHGA
jgi:hypothetical protein